MKQNELETYPTLNNWSQLKTTFELLATKEKCFDCSRKKNCTSEKKTLHELRLSGCEGKNALINSSEMKKNFISKWFLSKRFNFEKLIMIYSQISVIRTSIIRNYWVIRRRRTVPTFFSITYCNKTTDYSNFDYPKNSIFRSDSLVPIKNLLLNYPSRFEVQMSRMIIMISLFGRVRFTHPSDLVNKVATGN